MCLGVVAPLLHNTGYMLLSRPVGDNYNTVRCHILGVLGLCVGDALLPTHFFLEYQPQHIFTKMFFFKNYYSYSVRQQL